MSSHLLLAVKDDTCTRTVLGQEGKVIVKLLLELIDAPSLSKKIVKKIERTLKIGAQYLLPEPDQRVEMLLTLIPQNSEQLKNLSIGQVNDKYTLV